mmetsp:Transcript_27367/g.38493  ORF Transcript_27367/g.38493 Transcript_27367/m.38493 type:complete len:228 (-) Transcript_27367:1151-1834(-)
MKSLTNKTLNIAQVKSGVANFFESTRTFTYKRIPAYDSATSDLYSQADGIVGFISRGLCHGSVLVHCQHGVSRSVTCALFYLMRKAGFPLKDALSLVQKHRPEAHPIPGFMTQLEKYETKCRGLGVLRLPAQEKGGDTGKASSSSAANKKRKIGPQIGPSRGPAEQPQTASTSPTKVRRIIGPSIGPAAPPPPAATTASVSLPKSMIGPSIEVTKHTCEKKGNETES